MKLNVKESPPSRSRGMDDPTGPPGGPFINDKDKGLMTK